MITAVERPHRLAYDMTAVYGDAPGFSTMMEVTIEAVAEGHRVRLAQQGFPTMVAVAVQPAVWRPSSANSQRP